MSRVKPASFSEAGFCVSVNIDIFIGFKSVAYPKLYQQTINKRCSRAGSVAKLSQSFFINIYLKNRSALRIHKLI